MNSSDGGPERRENHSNRANSPEQGAPAGQPGSPEGQSEHTPRRAGPRASYPTPQSPQSRRRWFIASVTTVLVAGVIIAFIGFQRFSDKEVSGEIANFSMINTSTVSISFNVSREDPNQPVICIVRVRDFAGAESGRREILIPAGNRAAGITTTVRTSRPPAVGEVFGCSESIPAYLSTSEGSS